MSEGKNIIIKFVKFTLTFLLKDKINYNDISGILSEPKNNKDNGKKKK